MRDFVLITAVYHLIDNEPGGGGGGGHKVKYKDMAYIVVWFNIIAEMFVVSSKDL